MRLEFPLALLLLLFLPLFFEESARKRFFSKLFGKDSALRFASPVKLEKFKSLGWAPFRAPTLSILYVSAFTLFVLALARPQSGNAYTEIDTSGRDIMLVLDVSPSMEALDFTLEGRRVNRLTALKSVVSDFIMTRSGDRMGLVVFGGKAFTQCPLTVDQGILVDFVSRLETEMAGAGTAIGDAIAISLKRLKEIESESKVLVLVTDGKNNYGQVDPLAAASIAAELGIKIHTVGIGQDGPAPFPVRGIFGTTRYVNRLMEFDEVTLKGIAAKTGGSYFNAKDTQTLKEIYQQIDKIEERQEVAPQYVEYEEMFMPFLLLGFSLWLLAELLTSSIFLRVP